LEYRFGDRTARVKLITAVGITTVRVSFETTIMYSVEQEVGWQVIFVNFTQPVAGQ